MIFHFGLFFGSFLLGSFPSVQAQGPNRLAPLPSDFYETPATSQSYWQKNFKSTFDTDLDTAPIPNEVDVVIIGTGISGASAAYTLSKLQPGLRVAVFDARGFCSGATGRNGGHLCRPELFDFASFVDNFGVEDAVKIKQMVLRNRDLTFDAIEKFTAKDVDARTDGSVSIFANEEERRQTLSDHEAGVKAGVKSEEYALSREDVQKMFRIPQSYPQSGAMFLNKCGVIWPRKFAQGLFKAAQQQMPSLSLHTYCPVTAMTRPKAGEKNGAYEVITPRGTIRARAVFHATDAYVSHLVPELAGPNGVTVSKDRVIAFQPNKPVPAGLRTHLPWSFGYDRFRQWIVQVPDGGPFIFGAIPAKGRAPTNDPYDDRDNNPPVDDPSRQAQIDFLEKTFPDSFGKINAKRDVVADWTGIMGFTDKAASIVGRPVKGSKGEFVSVGHNGEGMGRAFSCSTAAMKALVAYLRGEDKVVPPEWFPSAYWRDNA